MLTYAEVKETLDGVATRIRRNISNLDSARSFVDNAVNDLTAMGSAYAEIVTEIDAQAAANPNSEAWQLALSEKDILVAEFQALKTTAQNLKDAMESV